MLNTLISTIPAAHLVTEDIILAMRVGLRVVHLVGLVLGLGAATLLDLMLFRRRSDPLTKEMIETVELFSNVVLCGLLLLWLTGIGFLIHYAQFDPQRLYNPKVWSKIVIVAVLSINGLFIHTVVLPHMRASVGHPNLSLLSAGRRRLFCAVGAVSAVSWYTPMLLGAVPQLNFTVPMTTILSVYALAVGFGTVVAIALMGPPTVQEDDASRHGAPGLDLQRPCL